jgi:hypothetical protein
MSALIPHATPRRGSATAVHVDLGGNPKELGRQVVEAMRRFGRPPQTAAPTARVPWRHAALFREPVYTDGQPYDDDSEDDGSKW